MIHTFTSVIFTLNALNLANRSNLVLVLNFVTLCDRSNLVEIQVSLP